MFRTIRSYLVKEVLPRRRTIICSPQLAIAIGLGAACWIWGDRLGVADTSISDITTAVLAYGAVAFGFCLAGLTIAMTLPDEKFARLLATRAHPTRPTLADGSPRNAYSDLLFVFSWTAVAHWCVIVWSFGMLIASGGDASLLPCNPDWGNRIAAAGLATLLSYAVFQFLITVITLSQVGNRYVHELRTRKADDPAPPEQPTPPGAKAP